MKKFLSVVLTLTMLISMFTTASAATIADLIDTPENENFLEYQLPIYVRAKKSGEADTQYKDATEGLEILSEVLKTDGVSVDYEARLDMSEIRNVFDSTFFDIVEGAEDFSAGKVKTKVTVTVEYDKGNVVNTNAGSLVSGADAYVQDGERSVDDSGTRDKITINFTEKLDNVSEITVADLVANQAKYFSDITFSLPNAVEYSKDGNYNIKVTLTGKTTFTFNSKTVNIGYSNVEGSGNYFVNAATDHKLVVIPAVQATCYKEGSTEGVICDSHDDNLWCEHHQVNHDGYNCGINGTLAPKPTPKLEHKYSDGKYATVAAEAVAPTCTENGVLAHWVCTLCKCDFSAKEASDSNKLDSVVVPLAGHNSDIVIPGRAATCTLDGLTDTTQCSKCGYKTGGKVIFASGHNIVVDAAIPATCTTAGKTEGKHCTECDYKIDQVDIAALGHSFGEWEITTEATESNPGEMTRQCIRDAGHIETKPIPQFPPSHICEAVEELAKITPATCDTPGSKQNYCECGLPFGDPIEISALGHDTEEKAEKTATCTDKGIIKHYACKTCGKLFRDSSATQPIQSAETPVDFANHGNKVVLPAVAATCTTDGWSAGEKCVNCNTVTKKQDIIPKSHTLELINAKDATCEDSGIVKHWHCKVCNKDFAEDKVTEMSVTQYTINPLGHIWGSTQITNAPTEVAEGVGVKYCNRDRNHSETVKIAKLEHIHNETVYKLVTSPTCTTNGKEEKVYTCCNEEYVGADKYRDILASHTYVDVSAVNSTCRTEGIKAHKYCTVCNKRFISGVEVTESEIKDSKLPHEFHSGNISPIPGEILKECDNCHEVIKIKSNTSKAELDPDKQPNKVKGDREDAMHEKDHAEAKKNGQKLKAESEMIIDETGLSEELENKIQNKDKAVEEKVVLDIVLKAISSFVDDAENPTIIYDQKKEIIEETEEFFEITINIPVSMQGMSDYRVYRIHKGTHTENDIITETENFYGEKIVSIDHTLHKVKIKVRRFSEYALVAYTEEQPEVVYPDPNPPAPTTGGGGSSSCTIKLNANGGTLLNDVKVKRGTKAELPVPTRSGYVFAGWYLDNNFTTPFDADTVINRNYTLYAKWVPVDECRGIEEDNCPCLKFYDLDPTIWYHRGVDYVLNRGMMIGVADTQFAPDWDVTRAMLVTVLWRAEGKPAAANTTFTDLEDGLYYVDAVKWAAANGVVNGYSDTVFAPNDAITREQFAAIMYRYAKAKGYDVSVGENTNILSYSDYAEISEYAIPAMQYTAGSGLIKGRTETTLNPKDNTTRAEMATILYRFFTENK